MIWTLQVAFFTSDQLEGGGGVLSHIRHGGGLETPVYLVNWENKKGYEKKTIVGP